MYKNFSKYILRTPLFSVDYFFNLTKNEIVTDDDLLNEFNNPIVKEAIYLASPVLYKEIDKWAKNEIINKKDIDKIKNSFLKYLTRISSRPTPFGLFAGSCVRDLDNINPNLNSINKKSKRYTRLDLNLTGLLMEHIESNIEIKNQLLYYPNSSLYVIANKLRYVESKYVNQNLLYQVAEIENSEYLSIILSESKNGFTIEDLAQTIIDSEISLEIAKEFIYDLIDNQILVSEMKQTVSGPENIDQIFVILNKIKCDTKIKERLTFLKLKLSELDLKLGSDISQYSEIVSILKEMDIEFNEKYIFQTDLNLDNNQNIVNFKINESLNNSLKILNKISSAKENKNLLDFKNAFLDRYESREMPLSMILDEEIGLGYPIKLNNGETNPLIDDLNFNNPGYKISDNIEWSKVHSLLLKKLISAKANNSQSIELFENEFENISANWNNLPDTFSTISQIVNLEGQNHLIFGSVVGSSAGNLLGRFCLGDEEMNVFIDEIIVCENKINSNKINAEIIHLPESRVGNILMRPSFREFEIPYLARSTKKEENQIAIQDLVISIMNNKIVLKSKKHSQEILPRLTTAHNYTMSTLPVYRFLCDLQFNNKRNYLTFDWGNLINEFSFFPRVMYKKTILSTAKWILNYEDIDFILKNKNKENNFLTIKEWLFNRNIPNYVYLVEGDNKLLINFSNSSSIEVFLSEIKFKKSLIFEEFLFTENDFCEEKDKESFVNEVIFSFYRDEILKN